MTTKRFLFRLTSCLIFCMAPYAHAGWYEIRNYAGTIGNLPIHMSLQTYDHINQGEPGQWHVDGSYYYDAHRIPIPLQGNRKTDGQFALCEASEPTSFGQAASVPAVSPHHPAPCPIKLKVVGSAATGEWDDGKKVLPITLHQVGQLDDTGSGAPLLEGIVEIPMWHHTRDHMLLGIYQFSKDCPLSMTGLRLINIVNGKVDKELTFDCGDYGTVATTIYTNVYRATNPRHVTAIASGGYHGMGEDRDITIEQ